MPRKKTTRKYTKRTSAKSDCSDWSMSGCKKSMCGSSCSGFGYFLGFLGAAIYYISTSTGFWNGVLGFLKAIIWPLFLVLEVLKFLGA